MKKMMFCLSLMLLLSCVFGSASAADFYVGGTRYDESARSLELIVNDYRSDGGQAPNSVEISLNGENLTDVSLVRFGNSDLPATFVFVVDNSSNAYFNLKQVPDVIAEGILRQRQGKNDDFYLVSFDHERQNVFGPAKTPADVLSNLNYASPGVQGKVDIHSALKKAVEVLNSDDKFSKKVIILVTDGNRLSQSSMTDQELHDLLSSSGYPVYVSGLIQSEKNAYVDADQDWLKNIGSVSGGSYSAFKTSQGNTGNEFAAHMGKSMIVKGTLPEAFGMQAAGTADAKVRMLLNSTVLADLETKVQLPESA